MQRICRSAFGMAAQLGLARDAHWSTRDKGPSPLTAPKRPGKTSGWSFNFDPLMNKRCAGQFPSPRHFLTFFRMRMTTMPLSISRCPPGQYRSTIASVPPRCHTPLSKQFQVRLFPAELGAALGFTCECSHRRRGLSDASRQRPTRSQTMDTPQHCIPVCKFLHGRNN